MTGPDADNAEPLPEVRAGQLGVRLARSEEEIDAAQALRYRIFYQEMGARPDAEAASTARDKDRYDTVADHLLVVDHALGEGPESIVGTYRMIRRSAAATIGQFYSEDEYDLGQILTEGGRILELGRSCIAADHRGRVGASEYATRARTFSQASQASQASHAEKTAMR